MVVEGVVVILERDGTKGGGSIIGGEVCPLVETEYKNRRIGGR